MRITTFTGAAALRERIVAKEQIDASVPESSMPAYMEMFLAHLRLLIGVPFDYLVPDARLLPDESIRFFYLDRSWTDRLVEGAIAVGKTGTREQAHHQAHSADIHSQLDLTERVVRVLQRGLPKGVVLNDSAGIVTGFLLRSAAVSGWPSMDVRAFSQVVKPYDPATGDYATWLKNAEALQLRTLRLELLSPSLLLALFDGVPQLVWCEEPHHGVQFGFTPQNGRYYLDRHMATGAIEPNETPAQLVPVPMRQNTLGVVAVQQLRAQLIKLNDPKLVPQTGSAGFAIELLYLPWRQRFEGTTLPEKNKGSGGFVPKYQMAKVVMQQDLIEAVKGLV